MKIIKCEPLSRSMVVRPGDTFKLFVEGNPVHSCEIDSVRTISHWALVEINGGLGYFIGDDKLVDSLKGLCL